MPRPRISEDLLINMARGRRFKEAHPYQNLVIDPTIDSDGPDMKPVIMVWFRAALRDEARVDQVLKQIDKVLKAATSGKLSGEG